MENEKEKKKDAQVQNTTISVSIPFCLFKFFNILMKWFIGREDYFFHIGVQVSSRQGHVLVI